jgi:hypothetical protein
LGISSTSTGATSPRSIKRTLALPDADTPSYWPVEMRSIMSSELAPSFVFTLQPVSWVNGFAHEGSA